MTIEVIVRLDDGTVACRNIFNALAPPTGFGLTTPVVANGVNWWGYTLHSDYSPATPVDTPTAAVYS